MNIQQGQRYISRDGRAVYIDRIIEGTDTQYPVRGHLVGTLKGEAGFVNSAATFSWTLAGRYVAETPTSGPYDYPLDLVEEAQTSDPR